MFEDVSQVHVVFLPPIMQDPQSKIWDHSDALLRDVWVLVSVNVCKAEEKERRLASTIESMQASHTLKNITLEVKILTK